MLKINRLFFCALCTTLLLNACALLPQYSYEQGGRFTLTYTSNDSKDHSESGRFQYREFGENSQLDLLTPLNGILARIDMKPSLVCLSKQDQESTCNTSTADLLYSALGFSMPIDNFGDLLKSGKLPEQSKLSQFWDIQVLSRHPDGRIKVLKITPKVPMNLKTLSVVID